MSLFEKSKMHLVLFVTRMVVMGFVRATCSRGGSVCKDWFDRAGKMVYWLTRNVLSVNDFYVGHGGHGAGAAGWVDGDRSAAWRSEAQSKCGSAARPWCRPPLSAIITL